MTDDQDELVAAVEHLFTYHPPTPEQLVQYQTIRDAGKQFALTLVQTVTAGPDRAVALRHIRDAVLSANAQIACGTEAVTKANFLSAVPKVIPQ